jgi:hypothetical protein
MIAGVNAAEAPIWSAGGRSAKFPARCCPSSRDSTPFCSANSGVSPEPFGVLMRGDHRFDLAAERRIGAAVRGHEGRTLASSRASAA